MNIEEYENGCVLASKFLDGYLQGAGKPALEPNEVRPVGRRMLLTIIAELQRHLTDDEMNGLDSALAARTKDTLFN
jgi:hypothetical protein